MSDTQRDDRRTAGHGAAGQWSRQGSATRQVRESRQGSDANATTERACWTPVRDCSVGLGVLLLVGGSAVATPTGEVAAAAQASQATTLLQTGAGSPSPIEYFTFIPQALLLLFLVGLRRYVLDDSDVPWWLDDDRVRARVDALVPNYGRRLRERIVARLSTTSGNTSTDENDDSAVQSGTKTQTESSTATSSTTTGTSANAETASSKANETTTSSSTNGSASSRTTTQPKTGGASTRASQASRAREPVPDRLALSYGNQRLVVADGDTVDEQIRAMLRAADEGDHAKWIDDRHLRFVRDEHGFTLVVDGENQTRLNGDRMRPGERARVYPGDEIELSGVVTLAVERP